MKRLIDAHALQEWICANAPDFLKTDDFPLALDFVLSAINAQKAVICVSDDFEMESEPVRHGRWKWANGYVGTMAECSVCGSSPMSFYALPKNQIGRLPVYKYCPRCGAKMDGVDENEKP